MKKLVLSIIAFILIVGGIVWLTTWTTSGLLSSHKAAEDFCIGVRATHVMVIANDTVAPEHIQALRCDRLTITNHDNKRREIAFGVHDQHVAYGGVFEHILKKDESFTFSLSQTGEYRFHDHFQDEVAGTFTVTD